MRFFLSLVFTIWMITFEPGIAKIVQLGNRTYNVSFQLYERYIGRRLELNCSVNGPNVTWYHRYLQNKSTTFNHLPERDCFKGEHECNLVINNLAESDAGIYICVDGVNSQGSFVEVTVCKWPKVKPSPFYNQTVAVGDNATFTCEADIGLINCSQYIPHLMLSSSIRRNGAEVNISSRITIKRINRTINEHQIGGLEITIFGITEEDFGSEVYLVLYDIEKENKYMCNSYLLQKDEKREEGRMYIITEVKVVIPVVVILLIVITTLLIVYYPRISYHLWHKRSLPDMGDHEFHGLLLYNEMEHSYPKVQKLRSALHQYRFKEYPPGPDAGEQQAGYERFQLLEQMCGVSACVIIVGKVDEVGERCLPRFQGQHVTHIMLTNDTSTKAINSLQWPNDSCCPGRNFRWTNFVYKIRRNLPRVNNHMTENFEEQLLNEI